MTLEGRRSDGGREGLDDGGDTQRERERVGRD